MTLINEWVRLPDGSLRWGRNGAGGLLLTSAGHVLLGRRGMVHHGGTWSCPGGAREPGESPRAAAFREFREEVRGSLDGLRYVATHRQVHSGGWTYSMVIAMLPEMRTFRSTGSETTAVRWVALDDVPDLGLHPGFAKSWATIRRKHLDTITRSKGEQS